MHLFWSWSLLYLCLLFGEVRAGTLDIQDNDPALVYSGSWLPDASPNAHGKHETWTNASGASVYCDFQGAYPPPHPLHRALRFLVGDGLCTSVARSSLE